MKKCNCNVWPSFWAVPLTSWPPFPILSDHCRPWSRGKACLPGRLTTRQKRVRPRLAEMWSCWRHFFHTMGVNFNWFLIYFLNKISSHFLNRPALFSDIQWLSNAELEHIRNTQMVHEIKNIPGYKWSQFALWLAAKECVTISNHPWDPSPARSHTPLCQPYLWRRERQYHP